MYLRKRKMTAFILALLMVFTFCLGQMGVATKANAEQNDVTLKLNTVNSWSDGKNDYLQVNGEITNNTNRDVTGWKVTVPFQASTILNQSWGNATYTMSQGTLLVTPNDYSQNISGTSPVTFGFIVRNPGEFQPAKATITYDGQGVTPTKTETPSKTLSPTQTAGSTETAKPTESTNPTPSATLPSQSEKKDWLYTDGSRICDEDGKEVWLTGTNWFGYNTGTNAFDGIWSCDLDKTIKEIANRGFNLLRVPISSELLLDWKAGVYPKPNYNDYVNPYLKGMNSLEIFDHAVEQCKKNGIKIMMDIHCATNAVAHYYPVWFTPDLSEEDYMESLKWMTERYKEDDTIIAVDLKNEPHGKAGENIRAIWNDSTDQYNWKYVATKAANAVLNINPNILIVVEGIEIYPKDIVNNSDYHSKNSKEYYGTWWGGNLRGVKDYPINLGIHQNKLVYSPHDYGPSVSQQPWFEGGYTQQSLYDDCWHDNWFYIQKENIAPLLIGEWGGFMTEPNLTWMTYLRDFIIENRINHTFWCFNANSGDTGGLVNSDFTTWDEEKYEFLKPALWQKDGRFVGLDHDTPLGTNGLSLSQY